MNPQTDTPESAEAMKNEARKITIGSATGTLFIDGKPTGTEIKIYNERGITREELLALLNPAERSDTALKLQRCEEALEILEADCINLHCALQSTAHMDPNDNRIPAITGAVVTDLGVMAKKAKALTHPTRNEGEKKV